MTANEAVGLPWVPLCWLLCNDKRDCVLPWGVCRRGDPWEGQVQGGRRSPHSSKSGLNLQMVLQTWHKAKLPWGTAACPALEASYGFSALLAQGRAQHTLLVAARSPRWQGSEDTALCCWPEAVRALWAHTVWAGWETALIWHPGNAAGCSCMGMEDG